MNIKKIISSGTVATGALLFSAVSVFAATTVLVTGNTSAGENQPGWMFNRDATTTTPYEFNTDEASIGVGSLYVEPITNTLGTPGTRDKFIAENFLRTPVSNINSISYDFQIAGNGDSTNANQFYLNVYANIDDTTNFYDCRYDYVPSTGSTGSFTTFSVTPDTVPTTVTKRGTRIAACPATLSGMPEGSHVRAIAINVGDTSVSASDTGLAGYLDNVVVNLDSEETIYNFDPALSPSSKDDCKKGGWVSFNSPSFKNQGQCVSYTNHN